MEPADRATAARQREAHRDLERENAAVQEGSILLSKDEQQIGSVTEVVFDPQSGRLDHLLVQRGIIFTRTIVLPAGLVARGDDDIVYLTGTADDVAQETSQPEP